MSGKGLRPGAIGRSNTTSLDLNITSTPFSTCWLTTTTKSLERLESQVTPSSEGSSAWIKKLSTAWSRKLFMTRWTSYRKRRTGPLRISWRTTFHLERFGCQISRSSDDIQSEDSPSCFTRPSHCLIITLVSFI
ncbi:hypothetical protein RvY_15767-2 [Ramazzottius varieornatus]|uniref:Uncharacterized protein n=1 Tax=Ramazzottius varieornatus TaxID=947166 RepID=A0A1D1VZ60_RAMVA|nr:hypothetical protein RvY_15767-2 [Ramazzottius varieornatus]